MAIKGLIFDLDGTVTLSQQFHAEAFAEVFKRHGLKYTSKDDARYSGRGSHCTFPEFFKEHGITLTPEQVEQYSDEKSGVYNKIIKKAHVKAVEGIENFLKKQIAGGKKIAMATGNKIGPTEVLLSKVHLKKYFPLIVTNRDVRDSKPAPDIFLKAAERMGLKPKECIVFEDAVNGVQAAKKAGMRCIALLTTTPKKKLKAEGADFLVKNYDEVSEELLK